MSVVSIIGPKGGIRKTTVAEILGNKKLRIIFNRCQKSREIANCLDQLREYLDTLDRFEEYKDRIHMVGMVPLGTRVNIAQKGKWVKKRDFIPPSSA